MDDAGVFLHHRLGLSHLSVPKPGTAWGMQQVLPTQAPGQPPRYRRKTDTERRTGPRGPGEGRESQETGASSCLCDKGPEGVSDLSLARGCSVGSPKQ